MSQRLVRRICNSCRSSYVAKPSELNKQFPGLGEAFPKNTTLYQGKGCKACNLTGYRGRTALFEIIPLSKELRALVVTRPSADQIWQLAEQQGAKSLFADGLEKVKNGETTLEELLRVAPR